MRTRTVLRFVASPCLPLVGAAALILLPATMAEAGSCGDDVDGQRVACACGDTVVSDTVLWPTDPVVTETCSYDGLTIFASHDVDGITLHLGGQSITGRGHGTGIRIARGGRLGATIVGGDADDPRAEVAHFRTGLQASGRDVLREVRAVDIHDNTGDGLKIHASGISLEDVRSTGNGRNGASVNGHGNTISDVSTQANVRDGLKVRGSAAELDATTTGNGRHGADIGGRGNDAEGLHAAGNGGAGVKVTGAGNDVRGMRATGNAEGNVTGVVK